MILTKKVNMSKLMPFIDTKGSDSKLFNYSSRLDPRNLLFFHENSFFFENRDKVFYRFNTPPFGFSSEPGKGYCTSLDFGFKRRFQTRINFFFDFKRRDTL